MFLNTFSYISTKFTFKPVWLVQNDYSLAVEKLHSLHMAIINLIILVVRKKISYVF